jgi:hypothetical protein
LVSHYRCRIVNLPPECLLYNKHSPRGLIYYGGRFTEWHRSHHWLWIVIKIRSCHHKWLIIRFVTRVKQQVPLLEQELLTLAEHLRSPPIFSEVGLAQSLVLCIVYWRSLFVLLSFLFWPLYCLSFNFWLLINLLVSSIFSYICRVVCPQHIYARLLKNKCSLIEWYIKQSSVVLISMLHIRIKTQIDQSNTQVTFAGDFLGTSTCTDMVLLDIFIFQFYSSAIT